MGGLLARGRRPFFLHPWWISRITGRSVGRPTDGLGALLFPSEALFAVALAWLPSSFQQIRHLLISGSARSRGFLDPSGCFKTTFPVPNRPHVQWQKAGMPWVGCRGLVWVLGWRRPSHKAAVPQQATRGADRRWLGIDLLGVPLASTIMPSLHPPGSFGYVLHRLPPLLVAPVCLGSAPVPRKSL